VSGRVYLVGAGPGEPGLMTMKGVECLRRADVLVYDRLISPALLDYAPAQAERIYVGKVSGDHAMPQSEINHLLIQKAREGKTVVRLKGGDPFVFGRGGEEALALVTAGISLEIVPGVSSAIAAPACAGIPVTHRGLSSSFAVFTGHRERSTPFSTLASPLADTLIFLMGVENLQDIVRSLLEAGCSVETPAALVRWGTTPRQETVVGTLSDILERSRELEPPAVLVVGQVVTLREQVGWFEKRPLFGKRILVTRAQEQAGELVSLLAEQGAEPIEFPVIQLAPVQDTAQLDEALTRRYDWVIFTSVNGVRAVWERLQAAERDARALSGTRLCAIGPATAQALATHGVRADFVPTEYVAQAILAGIGDVSGQRILLPRADIARQTLADGLRRKGAVVDEVAAYRTVIADDQAFHSHAIRNMLVDDQIDAITFTSSSTVRGLVNALGTDVGIHPLLEREIPKSKVPVIACIGPVTAQTARELGLSVDVVAPDHTLEGLVAALVSYYQAG
jgi:uroporphyrinogen III methyltransferase/synthase